MKKRLAVLLMVLLCLFTLAAKGSKETTETKSNWNRVTSRSLLSSVFSGLGSRITTATEQLCLNVTPFPSALSYYYAEEFGLDPTDVTGDNTDQVFLFNLLNYKSTKSTAASIESEAGITYGTTRDREKKAFGMVAKIFAALMILEVLFTSIWGYITDREGSLLKQVLSRILIGFLAFLLVSALPFLIEAMKVGFTKAAVTLTGTQDSDAGKKLLSTSVFHLPEIYMETCGDILDMMDPERVAGTDMDIISGSGWSIKAMYRIVYFIARIVAGILCCLVTIHIVMNIVEVYLVLALAAVLIPFMTFSPLKMFGEKAINALLANVLELFVIIVILLTCVNVAQKTITDYLMTVIGTAVSTDITFYAASKGAYETLNGPAMDFKLPERFTTLDAAWADEGDAPLHHFSVTHTFKDGKGKVTYESDMAELETILKQWYERIYTNVYKNNGLSFQSYIEYYTSTLGGHKMTLQQARDATDPAKKASPPALSTVPSADVAELNGYIYGLLAQSPVYVEVVTHYPLEEDLTNERLMTIHLILSFFIILFSVKFINDSSQITNSLLMGSLWTFGIDGMGMRGAMNRAFSFATSPARVAGKAAGTAAEHMGERYMARRRASSYASGTGTSASASTGSASAPSSASSDGSSSAGGTTPPGAQSTPGGSHA